MSLWSFGAQPSQLTTRTFRNAKSFVARIVSQSQADEVGAGDAIGAAIDEFNRHRWEYLTVRGSDITLVAGTSDYALPTPFKDPLSLVLVSPELRTLTYVPRGTWDPIVQRTAIGGTWFYTNFAQGLTNMVQLLDAPDAAGTMELRYYRPIAKPIEDTDVLDVLPGPMEVALLARAQVWVATWKGLRSERLMFMEGRAQKLFAEAKGDDVSHADWTPQLIPGRLWMRRPINADSVPGPWGW